MAERYDDRHRGDAYGRDRHRDPSDRGFMDRAGDEVRSWFGDDEAARRRDRDTERERYRERGWSEESARHGRSSRSSSEYDPSWERRGGYGAEQGRSARWGTAPEWRDESSAADSYRGYAGLSTSRGWSGGSADRDDPRRQRYDVLERETRRSTMGYPPYSGWDMPAGEGPGRGQFAGRGPKDYHRSDDRIREDVCDRLTDDPDIDASDIEVTVNRAEVTLSGTVRHREDKRRAEDLVERISGVREVNNVLRVNRSETAGTASDNPGNVIGVGGTAVSGARSGTDANAPGTRR